MIEVVNNGELCKNAGTTIYCLGTEDNLPHVRLLDLDEKIKPKILGWPDRYQKEESIPYIPGYLDVYVMPDKNDIRKLNVRVYLSQ